MLGPRSVPTLPTTMRKRRFLALSGFAAAGLTFCKKAEEPATKLRFGHFPNITHVQGLVAHQLSRRNEGWFEKRIGLPVEWYTYNAGPSAAEAIFAGSLDVTYIGPSPVLNAYSRSNGKEMRVLSGAANGGTALLIRADSTVTKPEDFRGKVMATPQLGNTQDVQARAWLEDHGMHVTQTGGEVIVKPTENPDQLDLLKTGKLEAVWTVEPWVTRLEMDAGAKVFYEDRDTNVTLLAARAAFASSQAPLAAKVVAAHKELTEWIKQHPAETKELVKAELEAITKAKLKDELIVRALSRVVITDDISRKSLDAMVSNAQKAGFLKDIPSLDALFPKV